MSEKEKRLLFALAWMCEQYLSNESSIGEGSSLRSLDHMCMAAGEDAIELLIGYGLVQPDARGGTWTSTGRAFLDTDL